MGTEARNGRHGDQRRGLPSTVCKALRIEDNTIEGTLLPSLTGGTRDSRSDGRPACSHPARRTCAAAGWACGCYLTSPVLSCWISSTCGRADIALLSQTCTAWRRPAPCEIGHPQQALIAVAAPRQSRASSVPLPPDRAVSHPDGRSFRQPPGHIDYPRPALLPSGGPDHGGTGSRGAGKTCSGQESDP
jgi:hypothetical protein